MNRPQNLGLFLLAIYLIVTGAISIFGIYLGHLTPLVPLLAVASGICLLLKK